MKKSWLVLAFLGFVFLALFFTVYALSKSDSPSFLNTVSFWENRINEVGPKIAYEEFAQYIYASSTHSQHNAAHTFGSALYEALGLDGLPICDERFSNGCFHSFSASAIAEGGFDETVPLMVSICNDEVTVALTHSCLHGVGHGIQAYLGYEEQNLSEAIKICREKTTGNFTAGCWGGVFMEYNLRSLIGLDSVRPHTTSTRYAPCDSLPEDLKPSCMYWQPEWWEEIALSTMTPRDFYLEAGGYCADVSDTKERNACFSGIGSIMPTKVANIFEGAEICRLIAPSVAEAISCWSFVYTKTPYSEKTELARENFCNKFVGDELRYCIEHKDFPADIFNERSQAIFP